MFGLVQIRVISEEGQGLGSSLLQNPHVAQFSQFEISYLLAKIKAQDVMTKKIITIEDGVAIEEAARIMADEKIGCLPVCDGDKMVGIITDNDLFGIMVDLMGGRRIGIRVTISQPDRAGAVARLTSAIAKEGGFISVFFGYPGSAPDVWISVCKVKNLTKEKIENVIDGLTDTNILDLRETIS